MSFFETLLQIRTDDIAAAIRAATERDVVRVLKKPHHGAHDFPVLISPAAEPFLEHMARAARTITMLRFGKTVKMYAPLYISNECVNACAYCGFNMNNAIQRRTLSAEEVYREAGVLHRQGFRHLLLVSGEHREKVSVQFLAEIARELSGKFSGLSIEVYPMDGSEYEQLARSGVTGIAIYQETYLRDVYTALHQGPKADFDFRLATPERAAKAGFRELGIGALLGLADFRLDLSCLAYHAEYLMKRYWKSQVAVSFPRLRRAEGGFQPPAIVSDKQLAQAVFALRMVLPDADLVLSTRERPDFRNGMAGLGITRMSAGSKTSPGGYGMPDDALEQFEVADTRSPDQVAAMLRGKRLEPVWKDFDTSFILVHDGPGGAGSGKDRRVPHNITHHPGDAR